MNTDEFVTLVMDYYHVHRRAMPWRNPEQDGTFDPYKILVSEMMLQQTQVQRVIPKYDAFIARFPDIKSLAAASFQEVMTIWSGLGYNRRAKYLHEAAKQLAVSELPQTVEDLSQVKGIGKNTAAAVLVYSYDMPISFIETNIRTVYLYHFFNDETTVDDTRILQKVAETLAQLSDVSPREFYWGLMDYGAHLKSSGIKNNAQSKHYAKQSKFAGSTRELRGRALRYINEHGKIKNHMLIGILDDDRAEAVLDSLIRDNMIVSEGDSVSLS